MSFHHKRIETLRKTLQNESLDAFLVLSEENRRYLSGFSAHDGQFNESSGALFITPLKLLLLTDSRYLLEATQDAPLYQVREYPKGLSQLLPDICKELNISKLGIETSRLSYLQFTQIQHAFGEKPTTQLIPVSEWVEKQRMLKDESEITLLRKALSISENAFLSFLGEFSSEMTEKDAAWILEKHLREQGAEQLSFPIISASGANAALPHATPGNQSFETGKCALFDFGGRYQGYCADITRTFAPKKADATFLQAFNTVLQAQKRAIAEIRAGVHGQFVDKIARSYLEENGFAGKFTHSLGHGVGLHVHEAPRLSPLRDDILEEGMMVTVEPGVYIEGWGGVRLEHMVVVRKDQGEVLNQLSCEEVLDRMVT